MNRMKPITLWTLGVLCQALLLAAVLIALLFLIAGMAGCASAPVYDPLPPEKPRPVLPPLVYPPDEEGSRVCPADGAH